MKYFWAITFIFLLSLAVPASAQDDKKIYFTEDTKEADIKIFIVEEESQAGWVNESKKGKL